ncbi:hypothetical protein Q5425_01235 [Amycolatopsis sp. A133]|uniref:hypothetical protein n=1 Tax=Amycolatopsis sp. A133 TaxID=3064472 RepID=UPI0027F00B38|nr:hypothetical protein [Amycolatopsis sp. A133]MDQ7802335.1 hypothetical protein [Amycolatopsis sp. A133]
MTTVDELVAIKQRVERELLDRPGVTGVDVGYKEVGGERTDQVAIRVHVARKTDDVPHEERIPEQIEGAVTDVVERRYELHVATLELDVSAQADSTHYATLQGGISMGPSRAIDNHIFAGTLGAIVVDNVTRARAALTNFHVAAVDSGWHTGDRMVQPSRIDTGVVPADEFGAILRATLSGNVDGAVISLDPGKASSCTVAGIGAVRGGRAAVLGMAVRKRGRTTGLSHGTVDGIAATVNVDYGDGLGVHTLTNQVSIAADPARNRIFSDHGDSGSVIVDEDGFVVGLLFAGAGPSTVANPIRAVLAELDISLCTGKSIVKDLKDGRKDFLKDKDVRKELQKEFALDKRIKDIRDVFKEREHGPGPLGPGGGQELEQRLRAVEDQLSGLGGFVGPELRPDLVSPLTGPESLTDAETRQLRAELEQQVADSVAAKSEFDAPPA